MAKKDIKLIIQGGALCAAFSFMIFINPALGSITNFFSLLPIFYVGICLGIQGFLFATIIPLIGYFVLLGPAGVFSFILSLFLPAFIILHTHFFKENGHYKFSSLDIVHKLSGYFLILITASFIYIKYSHNLVFENFVKKIKAFNNAAKISLETNSLIESIPGITIFIVVLMIWLNFQTAYALALKANKNLRKQTKRQLSLLPPVWDIAFIFSLWLVIANQLFVESLLLNIFSRAALCLCSFPLLIDGIEIIQLVAKVHKLPPISITIFIMLTFLLVWPMIFIVLLGLIEPLCGIKKKYYSKSN